MIVYTQVKMLNEKSLTFFYDLDRIQDFFKIEISSKVLTFLRFCWYDFHNTEEGKQDKSDFSTTK